MYFVFLCFNKNEINITNNKKKETSKFNWMLNLIRKDFKIS